MAVISVACTLLFLSGCGQTGTPQAPSLKLPTPVTDLAAARTADRVTLQWTMPRRTTDKLPLKGLVPVQICRRVEQGACVIAGNGSFEMGKLATYDDQLPGDLTSGSPRLLAYSVDVLSPHGRSAGASNIAYSAAGSPPPAPVDAHGSATVGGVLLEWQPASLPGTNRKVELRRTLLSIVHAAKSGDKPNNALRGTAKPDENEQMLVVQIPEGRDPGKAVDTDAAPDQRYSYRISRVATVKIDGKTVDIAGSASAEVLVDTKDTFAPAAPTGLAAIAASNEGAIDLSWAPSSEADLAGYAVYRSEGGGSGMRLTPAVKPVDTPAYRDATAEAGRSYTYSVTAIDHHGNESARSAPVTETLPPKP